MRRRWRWVLGALLAVILLGAACSGPNGSDPGDGHHRSGSTASSVAPRQAHTSPGSSKPSRAVFRCPCPNLAPGSHPSVLPGPVLIADHLNNRLLVVDPNGTIAWEFPRPGSLRPGQTFLVPDDAFFTPDGRYIVATQEDDFVISLIDVRTGRIVWRYGTPGVAGSGPNHLWNPDDAMMMPDGDIITADIKNCRVLILRPPLHHPLHVYGMTTDACLHAPPGRWGSPNGAFPMTDGHYVVTEINGDWADGLTLSGRVTFSTNPPGVNYPSDTNEVRPGVFLATDYSDPGQIVEFTRTGRPLWRLSGHGLNQPSLAIPLPNGDILANDDWSHRVIVIDPHTDHIVWQYGHTGVHGAGPGYLYDPDGVDLVPPYSFTMRRARTMGNYPVPVGAAPAPGQLRQARP